MSVNPSVPYSTSLKNTGWKVSCTFSRPNLAHLSTNLAFVLPAVSSRNIRVYSGQATILANRMSQCETDASALAVIRSYEHSLRYVFASAIVLFVIVNALVIPIKLPRLGNRKR